VSTVYQCVSPVKLKPTTGVDLRCRSELPKAIGNVSRIGETVGAVYDRGFSLNQRETGGDRPRLQCFGKLDTLYP
jgi:hypothetical protein